MKKAAIVLVLITLLLTWAFNERRMLAMRAMVAMDGDATPALLDAAEEGANVQWFDDYFTIETLAPNTFAIGEPRYHQQNYSYLLVGNRRALLFDAGPGVRDLRQVAESLTDKPITFLPSHLHYDHVGNEVSFERVALPDIPVIRQRADGNSFSPSDVQHLGFFEGVEAPVWQVSEWVALDSEIDLGQRTVKVLYTPGHTDDSVSIWDSKNGIVFSGDYLYPGPLYGFLPNSSLSQYMDASVPLLEELPDDIVFHGAHRMEPPGAPVLRYEDLEDLHNALIRIRDGELQGEGSWPQSFPINEGLWLLAEPTWLQDWE